MLPDIGNFPVESLTSNEANNLMRRSVSPFDYYPSYETIPADELRYITVSELEVSDQVKVEKFYKDLNGDYLQA